MAPASSKAIDVAINLFMTENKAEEGPVAAAAKALVSLLSARAHPQSALYAV